MDWLTTNHQVLADKTSTNLRKGYRVGDLTKNRDPDKSNTPLLLDHTPTLEKELESGKWRRDIQTRSPNKSNPENPIEDKLSDEWTEVSTPSPRHIKTPNKSKRCAPSKSPLLSREWKGQESEQLLIDFRDEGAVGESDGDVWDPGWEDVEQDVSTKGYRRISSKRN